MTEEKEKKEPVLRFEINFYEDDILIESADTYSFEMAETHLGCMERHYQTLIRQRELAEILKDDEESD